MRDLAFAIVWVVLFPVALWSAHIGVLLWIWVALLVPNQELYGFMAGIPFNKVVVFATVFAIFFGRDKKKFYVDSTVTLCVLFFYVQHCHQYSPIIKLTEYGVTMIN